MVPGTADAVWQNLDILSDNKPDFVLILAGDHVYKMDYGKMLAAHVATGADVTVACLEVPIADARGFGVIGIDEQGRVVEFQEKPEQSQEPARRARPRPGQHGHLCLLHRRSLPRDGAGRRRSRLEPRLRPGRDPLPRRPRARGLALLRGELRRHEARHPVLARRGHARRLLGSEHGAHPGDAGPEPLRQGLAHLDVPGAAPAGQVRLRRGRPAGDRPSTRSCQAAA